ncbi:MAG: helix-turn-helix domain-containing protein [Victivallaceae bacterium]|nr:helix-turn-helix domain-containing protein [Victivallaceae bacterium]
MANSDLIQSVIKALDILHAVSNTESGIRLNDLAESFGMNKTTVHNLVRTLRARDYLTKDSANRYRIGAAVSELLSNQHRNKNLRRAGEVMRKLYKELPESVVTYSELCGSELFCRLRMSPDQPNLLQRPVSMMFQPYNQATGLCFQAFYDEYHSAVQEKYPFDEFASHKWKNIPQFEQQLDAIRKAGYYLRDEPDLPTLLTVPAGESFVLGVKMTEQSQDKLADITAKVIAAAQQIKGL